ncbi:MAG: alpha/beta fold hydrolase [Notoacmeibacter sp.]|nr:alpha/beta fold hydrolase [Notoacmeibacter sp.]
MAAKLHAAECGAGETTLVLLHGFGASHHVWEAAAARLAGRTRILAYDLPAHGASLDFPGGGPVRVAVDAVLDDLSARGIERFNLAGHSMGGAISALIALKAPERVSSLTLVCPGGFGPGINMRLLSRYGRATQADEIRTCLENMYGWNTEVPEAEVEQLVALRRRPGQREKLEAIAAGMTRDGVQGVIPRDKLAQLPMPVKVLWGTQDRVLPAEQVRDLPAIFAAHVFDGAGHMLLDEEPDAVVRLIGENLR